MAITINTNMSSLVAQKSLNTATSKMNTSMQRLSTGARINSSKDDAAGSAVATRLNYKISSLDVAKDNAQMGSSLLETAEGTLDVVQSNLERIRDLTEQAANGTYGSDAMTAIKAEIQGRLDEVTRIADTTEFNGKNLLDGSMDAGINLQIGIGADSNSVIKLSGDLFKAAEAGDLLGKFRISGDHIESFKGIGDDSSSDYIKLGDKYYNKPTSVVDGDKEAKTYALGNALTGDNLKKAKAAYADEDNTKTTLDKDNLYTFQSTSAGLDKTAEEELDSIFTNDAVAQVFIKNVDDALENVTARKTAIGAAQQRVNSAMEVTQVMSNNLTSAKSLIEDADIAKESSNYIKNQILQQTASSLLATANQNPSIALSLI